MTPTDIINTRIERAIKELVDLDMTIARNSGQVSIGFSALKEMSITLKANAQRAIHSPKVTDRDINIHDAVVRKGYKIKEAAAHWGISPSTVRRSMDKVTENDCLVARS